MALFDEFAVGDRVHHRGMGENGIVTAIRLPDGTQAVCVTYDRCSNRANGSSVHWKGQYDQRWFELLPNLLVKGDIKKFPVGPGFEKDELGNDVRRVGV